MGNKKAMNLAFAIVGASLFNVGEVSAQTFFQCIACEAGTYESNGKCAKCPSGTFSSVSGASSSLVCQPCQAGHYCPEGAQVEYSCPKGTYSDKNYATSCKKCSKGYYNDKVGQTACQRCSGNGYSNAEGSERCQYWNPNYFGIFYGKEDGIYYPRGNTGSIIYSEEIPEVDCAGIFCRDKHDSEIWCKNDFFEIDPASQVKKVCGLSIGGGSACKVKADNSTAGGCCHNIKYVVATEDTEIHIDDGYASHLYGYKKIWGNRGTYYIYPDGHIEERDKYADEANANAK